MLADDGTLADGVEYLARSGVVDDSVINALVVVFNTAAARFSMTDPESAADAACRALVRLGPRAAAALPMIAPPEGYVAQDYRDAARIYMTRAIEGTHGTPEQILIDLLRAPEPVVRMYAAREVEALPASDAAVAALVGALEDTERLVVLTVATTLCRLEREVQRATEAIDAAIYSVSSPSELATLIVYGGLTGAPLDSAEGMIKRMLVGEKNKDAVQYIDFCFGLIDQYRSGQRPFAPGWIDGLP
jgi:hypothetical protein